MKFLKNLPLLGLILATGCINIDYVGQRLQPTPKDQLIVFFNVDENYNSAIYSPLGRASVTAPDGTSMLDIKEDLQDQAREVGADAIKIVSFKKINTGTVYATNALSENSPNAYSTGNQSRAVGGDPIYTDSFGQTGQLQQTAQPRIEVVLEVIFLADTAKLNVAMQQRKEKRNERPLDDEALALDPNINFEE